MQKKKVIIIGSGIAGLSASAYLGAQGFDVTILEKNTQPGGRARQFSAEGFTFDMGPSWYWMPDVFEKFYNDFGFTTSDFYTLTRLDPSYKIFWKGGEQVDIPATKAELWKLFEKLEPGSSRRLEAFLSEAAYKYDVGMNELVYKPGLSLLEFADKKVLSGLLRMDVLTSMKKHIRSFVKHPLLVELLEFPILFLGALPANTPALYSLMNHADITLGTWYPMGGMYKIIEAFVKIAEQNGVKILCDHEVRSLETSRQQVSRVHTSQGVFEADYIIGAGDYHHIEQQLLPEKDRTYSPAYWNRRKMAPSSLLFYMGINKKLDRLQHHNLFFDEDFMQHAHEIYTRPQWPTRPLFYVSAPSRTDHSVTLPDAENLFMLIPVAPGLKDTTETRERYYDILMDRLEQHTGQNIRDHVIFKKSYAHNDFITDYNAYKGNAYGLANTLNQTALLKPKIRSNKLSNLYYAGQLTVPGPGIPPGIISGKVAASLIINSTTS
jgi:phytoene desaturase